MSILAAACCEVDISAPRSSLVRNSTTECGVSVCELKASKIRKTWPTMVVKP